jgi:hypothetical protein
VSLPALKEPHFFAQIQPSYEQWYLRALINDHRNYLKLFRHTPGFRALGRPAHLICRVTKPPKRIRQKTLHAWFCSVIRLRAFTLPDECVGRAGGSVAFRGIAM